MQYRSKWHREAVMPLAILLIGTVWQARPAEAAQHRSPTSVTKTSESEITGAKGLVARIIALKSDTDVPKLLTNETAASLGSLLLIPVMMQVSMEQMGGQMTEQMGHKRGEKSVDTRLRKDLETLSARYHLQGHQNAPSGSMPPQLTRHGREFMGEVELLLKRLQKTSGKASGGFRLNDPNLKSPEDLNYKVLSPTRVQLIPKKAGSDFAGEARLEDSAWRLHIDMAEVMKRGASKRSRAVPSQAEHSH